MAIIHANIHAYLSKGGHAIAETKNNHRIIKTKPRLLRPPKVIDELVDRLMVQIKKDVALEKSLVVPPECWSRDSMTRPFKITAVSVLERVARGIPEG
ncbi:hypothetical protein HO173_002143 [Letharia columbiana]|uniref:Uncharacterized protein n=1 Tax=Letharia columbiana TaxID=112416 RepID=A0A8H6G2Z3_9LECA|nr:uncharacterized protein HO173_002143 [Letharia columbiana]KAF6239598.1 hypothetical protein HO173_002143 [Letharia columbiana]